MSKFRAQLGSVKFLRLLWTACALIVSLLHTLAFASADWLVAKNVFGYEKIRLGPAFACFERDGFSSHNGESEQCGAYGLTLSDIPHTSWRAASFFLGLAAIVLWIVVVVSPVAVFNSRLGKTAAFFMGVAGETSWTSARLETECPMDLCSWFPACMTKLKYRVAV